MPLSHDPEPLEIQLSYASVAAVAVATILRNAAWPFLESRSPAHKHISFCLSMERPCGGDANEWKRFMMVLGAWSPKYVLHAINSWQNSQAWFRSIPHTSGFGLPL